MLMKIYRDLEDDMTYIILKAGGAGGTADVPDKAAVVEARSNVGRIEGF